MSIRVHFKQSRVFCAVGIALLFFMALFHGSGLFFVNDVIMKSNTEGFLKAIFPVLFIHPSIHLIGLSIFGILAIHLREKAQTILIAIAILVVADALAAFYLGAFAPGILLTIAAICFLIPGLGPKKL
ncbi:MAG: hypothetical protein AAGB24_14710 [Bacteroidota bacterium]